MMVLARSNADFAWKINRAESGAQNPRRAADSEDQELRARVVCFQPFLLSTFKGLGMGKAGKQEASRGGLGLIP
jgi:hypothetical protein